jgi:drug/metabolite transporter (DMT)-like permease
VSCLRLQFQCVISANCNVNTDSLLYLPLADATVITFLAPSLACWACSFLINEPFTRMEQIAAYVSLFGVVLIARPAAFFSLGSSTPSASGAVDAVAPINGTADPDTDIPNFADYNNVTPQQRLMAVGIAMIGVLGAAGAYTTIRWIGKRAHALISVNYFATWCTIVSIVMMFSLPGVGFLLPKGAKEWGYLFFLGICGFVMQFLLAAGLQYEKSSRATNMVYTQMLFALAFDKIIFGTTPGLLSIVGSSLILGSAIYVAVHKDAAVSKAVQQTQESAGQPQTDEEQGLMAGMDDAEEEGESIEMINQREREQWEQRQQERQLQERVPLQEAQLRAMRV